MRWLLVAALAMAGCTLILGSRQSNKSNEANDLSMSIAPIDSGSGSRIDDDLGTTPPDAEPTCQCSTPACCGSICQTQHMNGHGQSFYDCNPLGTYSYDEALEACVAYTGDSAKCLDDYCAQTPSDAVVCGCAVTGANFTMKYCNQSSNCVCWEYAGSLAGRVSAIIANDCQCPFASDPTWN
jgi:hypothetical protein